jgi:hypothetical protein
MPAGSTYTPIATTTLGTANNQVTFSAISGSYTDLVLTFTGGSASGQALLVQVNADTGANYSSTELSGNGSSASSSRDPNTNFANIGGVWNSTGANILQFMNYSNSTTYKTILTRNSDAGFVTRASVSLWRNTNAITSIKIFPNSSVNFNVGSTFTLYGIAAA